MVNSIADVYERELGIDMSRDVSVQYLREALRAYWKNKFRDYYRGKVNVDGKWVELFEIDPWYLPPSVLGMTDCFSTIWLRKDLDHVFGYGAREKVLRHEKEHVRDPTADEMTVRRRTNTVSITPYSMN